MPWDSPFWGELGRPDFQGRTFPCRIRSLSNWIALNDRTEENGEFFEQKEKRRVESGQRGAGISVFQRRTPGGIPLSSFRNGPSRPADDQLTEKPLTREATAGALPAITRSNAGCQAASYQDGAFARSQTSASAK